jgi:hypothetical protein
MLTRCSRCGGYQNPITSSFGYCDECERRPSQGDRVIIRSPQPAYDGRQGEVKGYDRYGRVRVLLDGDKWLCLPLPLAHVEPLA